MSRDARDVTAGGPQPRTAARNPDERDGVRATRDVPVSAITAPTGCRSGGRR